MMTHI